MHVGLLQFAFAGCSLGLLAIPCPLRAQFSDRPLAGEVAERKIDQLRLDDSLLRSEISSAQIARQVEITRLEGRIIQLEEQLRDLPRGAGSMEFAFVLGLTPPTAAGANEERSEAVVALGNNRSADAIHELVVRDFLLSTEIELLDARSRLLEKSREVKSLERLSSKGLASAAQLELQIMQRRRAELQVERREKQIAGLRKIYPAYFAE